MLRRYFIEQQNKTTKSKQVGNVLFKSHEHAMTHEEMVTIAKQDLKTGVGKRALNTTVQPNK